MSFATGGEITFRPIVWPTWAGALMENGEEPRSNADYERGPLIWELDSSGVITGRVRILVPKGEWSWIIYCYHPEKPEFLSCQRLSHPLRLLQAGYIQLDSVTESDVIPPELKVSSVGAANPNTGVR